MNSHAQPAKTPDSNMKLVKTNMKFLSYCALLTVICLATCPLRSPLLAQDQIFKKSIQNISHAPNQSISLNDIAKIDANSIEMTINNNGNIQDRNLTGGLIFPKGSTLSAIYELSLSVGALVNSTIHVAVARYGTEYRPGVIEAGNPADPDDPRFRIYKITMGDGPGTPDYDAWPITDGAPTDKSGNPLLLGDQTLWYVLNDADPAQHTQLAGKTAPLGIEIQQTTFAYRWPNSLAQTVFVKYRIINKGGNLLQNTYLQLFLDADVGTLGDDLSGFDQSLQMSYWYNSTNNDAIFEVAPPAVGVVMLQGPEGNNGTRLALASFRTLAPLAQNSTEIYNYMQGRERGGSQTINPVSGLPTTFMFTGDPIMNTGWVDDAPADKRSALSAGPFNMAPGDTQEVVYALLIGQGKDRLNSIEVLRSLLPEVTQIYTSGFPVPNPPAADAAVVTIDTPPSRFSFKETQKPSATIAQLGSGTHSFPVTFTIKKDGAVVYQSHQNSSALSAGQTQQIKFEPWTTSVLGIYDLEVAAGLGGDVDFSNDVLRGQIEITGMTQDTTIFLSFQVVANAAGPVDPPTGGAADFQNFPVPNRPGAEQQVGPGVWLFHTGDNGGSSGGGTRGPFDQFLTRVVRADDATRLRGFDFEMRFTQAGGFALWAFESGLPGNVPFELWNIGRKTPNDPSDDYRMIPWVLNDLNHTSDPNTDQSFDLVPVDHSASGADNDPYTDWVYWFNPEDTSPGTAGYDKFVENIAVGTYDRNRSKEVMARTVLINWNGGSITDGTVNAVNQLMPETGTIFRILTINNIISAADSLALVALHNNTTGGGWSNNTNWLSTEPVPTWHGVIVSDGRVTDIILDHNNLVGSLPQEIGNLSALVRVVLNGNKLSGAIPSEIGNLTSLTKIDLSHNSFSGAVPAPVANLTGLVSLKLSDNGFVTLPNLSAITTLTELSVENNQLSFEDIEPNMGITGFVYSPQDSVGTAQVLNVDEGGSLTLSVTVGGNNNRYQWLKDGQEISGATATSFTIAAFNSTNTGSYICKITNTIATDLTLFSRTITLEIGSADTQPPQINHSAVSSAVSGKALTISASLTDNQAIATATLHFRSGGANSFTVSGMNNVGGNSYEGTIPSSALTKRGAEYFVKVLDGAGNATTFPTAGESAPQVIQVTSTNLTISTPATAYRMISVPIDLDNSSAQSIFEDDLGTYDDKQWRLLRFLNGSNVEFPNAGSLEPGHGFWLITRTSQTFGIGSGKSVTTADKFRIILQPGWNQIGNPFAFTVKFNDLVASGNIDPVLVGYSGSLNDETGYDFTRTQLEPFQGYFVNNKESNNITLEIPSKSATGSAALVKGASLFEKFAELEDDEWMLQLKAKTGRFVDKDNYIGGLRQASEEWDRHDFAEAPFFDKFVSLSFPHYDWQRYPNRYTGDFRALGPDGGVWDFVVNTNMQSSEVVLTLSEMYNLPDDWQVTLLDKASRMSVYLLDQAEYRFMSGAEAGERKFRIIVGSAELTAENDLGFEGVPETFTVSQNYPNPFNPETRIDYELPKMAEVQIRIYDLKGRLINILFNAPQSQGRYTISWNGKTQDGGQVASGVYVLSVRAGNFATARKMILVR